jgi:hypothetical protein
MMLNSAQCTEDDPEMNILKINRLNIGTLTLGSILMVVSPSWAGDIVLSVEEPAVNSTYSGVANLRGWVVSSAGISRVELYVDSALTTHIPVGGRRTDVGSAYPNYPDSSNAGFSMAFNYSSLTAGPHTLQIRAIDRENASREQSVNFTVARFNPSYIADPAKISLAGATGSFDSRSIYLKNLTADGQAYDVRLDWRTEAQGFAITQINPAGSAPEDDFGGTYRSRVALTSNSCAFAVSSEAESELKLTQNGSQMSGMESGQLSVAGTVDGLGNFALTSARLVQNPTTNCRGESYFSYQGNFPSQTIAITTNYEYFGSCQYRNCAASFQGSITKTAGADDSSSVASRLTATILARPLLELAHP